MPITPNDQITILIYLIYNIMILIVGDYSQLKITGNIACFARNQDDKQLCWIDLEKSLKKNHGSWSLS